MENLWPSFCLFCYHESTGLKQEQEHHCFVAECLSHILWLCQWQLLIFKVYCSHIGHWLLIPGEAVVIDITIHGAVAITHSFFLKRRDEKVRACLLPAEPNRLFRVGKVPWEAVWGICLVEGLFQLALKEAAALGIVSEDADCFIRLLRCKTAASLGLGDVQQGFLCSDHCRSHN